MERAKLFEIADQPWLPGLLKEGVTDNLQLGLTLFKPYNAIAPHLAEMLDHMGAQRVLDLGSGGSGPWTSLLEALHDLEHRPKVILSDLYPNPGRLGRGSLSGEDVSYWPQPVDARAIPEELADVPVRTLFTAMHHFSDDEIREMVACCIRDGVAFGAFEFTERRPREVPMSFFAALFTTVLFSPAMWQGATPVGLAKWVLRMALSPLIGLINAWDGAVSVMRTHTPQEVEALVHSVHGADTYTWRIGLESAPGLTSRVLYVVSWPTEEEVSPHA